MRLFLGYQSMITYNTQYDTGDSNAFDIGSATYYGTTTAPDGSSIAEGYVNNASPEGSRSLATLGRTDLTSGYDIYTYSSYIKPIDSEYTRALLYLHFPNTTPWKSAYLRIDFTGGELHAISDHASFRDIWSYSYKEVDDGWFNFSFVLDTRNIEEDHLIRARLYPNDPHDYWSVGHGCYFWNTTLNKTKLRNVAPPATLTSGSIVDHSDFICVDFTQLPSNIEEVEENIHESKTFLNGNFSRTVTYSDHELKTLVWEKIDYTKHGKMIYNLRESLRDKIGQDCVLEYPEGFKSHIRSAVIRVVDFRFTYTEINNIANVELDYYIVSTHNY